MTIPAPQSWLLRSCFIKPWFFILPFLFFVVPVPVLLGEEAQVFQFQADRMSGSRTTGQERTVLMGNVQIHSDNLVLKADKIEISGDNNRYLECTGTVTGTDSEKGVTFQTQSLKYDRKLKIAHMEGDSVLEDKTNKVVAKARYIEYNDPKETAVLEISVRIFKEKLVCRSQYALYQRSEKNLFLSGFPVVYKDQDEFRANTMKVNLDTEDIIMDGSVSGAIKGKKADGTATRP